jgi:WD40 repeat protein
MKTIYMILLCICVQFYSSCDAEPIRTLDLSITDIYAHSNQLAAIVQVRKGWTRDERKKDPLWARILGTQHPIVSKVVTERQYYKVSFTPKNPGNRFSVRTERIFETTNDVLHEFYFTADPVQIVHRYVNTSASDHSIALWDTRSNMNVQLPFADNAQSCLFSDARSIMAVIGKDGNVSLYDLEENRLLPDKPAGKWIESGWSMGHEMGYGLSDDLTYFGKYFYSYTRPLEFNISGKQYSKTADTVVVWDKSNTTPVVVNFKDSESAAVTQKVRGLSSWSEDVFALIEATGKGRFERLTICDLKNNVKHSIQIKAPGPLMRFAWDAGGKWVWIIPADFLSGEKFSEPKLIQVWDYKAEKVMDFSVSKEDVKSLFN